MKDNIYQNFSWFVGVIEDINDPEEMGRVKVRCYGYHTDDKDEEKGLPTEHLPWAHQMIPITSASMSGIGRSGTGLLPGSWVVGFFRDGVNAQEPVIMGSFPSVSFKKDPEQGFSDPDDEHPRNDGEIDTPEPARKVFAENVLYKTKDNLRQEQIETAIPGNLSTVAEPEHSSYYTRNTWDNLRVEDIISPKYPDNHVHEYRVGHVNEYDETEGYERISDFHKSGTYNEVTAEGDKTLTVVGNEYQVTFKNKNVYVKGNCNLTIDGDMRTLVKGNYHLEVEGNKTEYIKGSRQSKIGKHEQIEVDQERSINVKEDFKTRIGGNEYRHVVKNFDGQINLNSDSRILEDSTHYIGATETRTTVGESKYTCQDILTVNAFKTMTLFTQQNLDVDASTQITITAGSNVDIDGSRIDLN
tara:strand:- start:317 stop:1558 length:1242 start_codon:yes stop_codon:yes gene_type:complete